MWGFMRVVGRGRQRGGGNFENIGFSMRGSVDFCTSHPDLNMKMKKWLGILGYGVMGCV